MGGCGCQGRADRLAVVLRKFGLRGLAAGFGQNHVQTLTKIGIAVAGAAVIAGMLARKAGM
jgi:hypothetical protein